MGVIVKLVYQPIFQAWLSIKNVLKLLQLLKYLLKLSELLLDTDIHFIDLYLQVKCQGCDFEHVLILLLAIEFEVPEQFVLLGYLRMKLEVVEHLSEVVRQSFVVNLSRQWTPPEMEVALVLVGHFVPVYGSVGILHHSFHQLVVVPVHYLVLKQLVARHLGSRQAVVFVGCGRGGTIHRVELLHHLLVVHVSTACTLGVLVMGIVLLQDLSHRLVVQVNHLRVLGLRLLNDHLSAIHILVLAAHYQQVGLCC